MLLIDGSRVSGARFSIASGCEQEKRPWYAQRKFKGLPFSKPLLETLCSLQTAMRVFEKPLPIRRPSSYDTDGREDSIRRDGAAMLRQKGYTTPCL